LLQPVGTPLGMVGHGSQLGPQLSTERTSQVPSPQRRVPALHSQVPPVQVSLASQSALQPPQCAPSVCVFTHWAPHIIMLAPVQLLWHMPFMQAVPGVHASPHRAQLALLPIGTHALVGPPQRAWPCGQPHTPPTQSMPVGHASPQPPQ
jgi:hypothetical protein